jgi:LEA14-like dessication related protein
MRAMLAAAAMLVLGGCAGLMGPPPHVDVSVSRLGLAGATLFEQTWDLTLRVQNPNDFAIESDGLSFRLDVNGNAFAHGVSDGRVTVPRLGETMVDVKAISDLAKVVRQLNDMARAGRTSLDYKLSGQLYSSGRRFPFEYNGTIDPLQ